MMASATDDVLAWLGRDVGSDRVVGGDDFTSAAADARRLIAAALRPDATSATPLPVARAQALVISISTEIEALHTNAAAARSAVAEARDALAAATSSTITGDADAWHSKLATAHDTLVSQIEDAEATKGVALETELVAGDAALEAALADCARAEVASAFPDATLAPLLSSLQARLAALHERTAALPLGPTAEATLVFVPAHSDVAAVPDEPVLGWLLTTEIRATDLVASPQWLRLSASGGASVSVDGTGDSEATPILHISVSPKAPVAALGPARVTAALETLLARGLLKVDAFIGSDVASADRITLRLVLDGPSRISALVVLRRRHDMSSPVLIRRLDLRGEPLPGTSLPLRIGCAVPLAHSLEVADVGRNHYQQPCVTLSGRCYIPLSEKLLIIERDGVTSERVKPPVENIRCCAFDDATNTLLLGTYGHPTVVSMDATTRKVHWNRRGYFADGVFALVMLPKQGVAVAACYANKIVALRLSDGEPIGASLSLRTRHLTVDRDTGRIYCPQSNTILVIEWQGAPALPDYGLSVVDSITFEPDPGHLSGENTVVGFVPRSGEHPAQLVTGRWGNNELCVVDLDARTIARVDVTAVGSAEGGSREPADVTGLAVDGPGYGVLVTDLRQTRSARVLPFPLPLLP